jgi:hypothetical protein
MATASLARPAGGSLTQFNAYVALSRSQSGARLMLLRNFKDEVFTAPPNPALVKEDGRLEELDDETLPGLNNKDSSHIQYSL